MQNNIELWNEYYQKILSYPHRVQTETAESLNSSENFTAIDCGCGTGRDISFLVSKGYKIYGFDMNDKSVEICKDRFTYNSNVIISKNNFESFSYPESGLIIANSSLFFCDSNKFETTWSKINSAISLNGVFCGDFMGHNDSWVKNSELIVNPLSKQQVHDLFNEYTIEQFIEQDSEGTTALGKTKHWHTYQVIAKRCTNK